jgi:hypothetical protein
MRAHFESATGTMGVPRVTAGGAVAGWVQTIGVVARLTGAVIASLPEALAVGARTGSPLRGVQALGDMFRSIDRGDMRQARQLAEWLGVVGVHGPDLTLAAQSGTETATALQRRITDGLFRMTGLHALTDRQRTVATRHGALFVRQMVDEIAEGAPTAASAKRLMAELGMDEGDARAVSAWLRRDPGLAEIAGEAPEARAYRTAITRFVNETIQNPEPVDKPMWSAHPVGRLAYGITSFMYAFSRNVVFRTLKQTAAAATESGLSLQDRARLAGPLAGVMVLMAAQYGVSEVRDALGNSRQRVGRDPWVTAILALDRAGVFANLSPLVNLSLSARAGQPDPATRLAGPYISNVTNTLGALLSAAPAPVGTNSPRTNNAENAAARAFYAGVFAPGVIAALAAAPLPAPARAVAGAASIVATRPDAQRAVADAVAGPRSGRGEIRWDGGITAGGGIAAR